MKIYKQNGDILELTVSEYRELFEEKVIKINTPEENPPKNSETIYINDPAPWVGSAKLKYPDIPGEGYMSTSTK